MNRKKKKRKKKLTFFFILAFFFIPSSFFFSFLNFGIKKKKSRQFSFFKTIQLIFFLKKKNHNKKKRWPKIAVDLVPSVVQVAVRRMLDTRGILIFYLDMNTTLTYRNRIKLDSNELDGSPSSTEITLTQPTVPANMKTQAAFVNKLYK